MGMGLVMMTVVGIFSTERNAALSLVVTTILTYGLLEAYFIHLRSKVSYTSVNMDSLKENVKTFIEINRRAEEARALKKVMIERTDDIAEAFGVVDAQSEEDRMKLGYIQKMIHMLDDMEKERALQRKRYT